MNIFQKRTIESIGFETALNSFKKASQSVPAYADFLRVNSVDPSRIRTLEDYKYVPIVTKENYLTKYPFKDLLVSGDIASPKIISMSSGSSGQPFFWPRNAYNSHEAAEMHRRIFDQFDTMRKNTLVVIAFAMGNWIAGTYTLEALQAMQNDGHRLTITTPGLDATAISRIFNELGQYYEQVIIMGYPPFVKDALLQTKDLMGSKRFGRLCLKVVLAGENISEQWRDYLMTNFVGNKSLLNVCLIYGTADAGMMGHETPETVAFRRFLSKANINIKSNFLNFSKNNTIPTIVKYYPEYKFFEEVNKYLIFTYYGALPLIRYQINDVGIILRHQELQDQHKEIYQSLSDCRLDKDHILMLASRSDVSTTFYALDIFPENIKYTLEKAKYSKIFNGKFYMTTEFDLDQNQTLHLYLQPNDKHADDKFIGNHEELTKDIVKGLKKLNGEYNRLYQELGRKAEPQIHVVSKDDEMFKFTIKNRWVG